MGLFSRRQDVGQMKEARDFERLAKTIKKDDDQRDEAVRAIGELGDPNAVPALVRIMDDFRTGDDAHDGVVAALRQLPRDVVLDRIVGELRAGVLGAKLALVALGDEGALGRLEALLDEPPYGAAVTAEEERAQRLAYATLMRLGTRQALEAVARGVAAARTSALEAVQTDWEGEERAVLAALVPVSGREQGERASGRSLEHLAKRIRKGRGPGDEALPLLAQRLTDPDAHVRYVAANTLLLVYSEDVPDDPQADPRTADPLAAACGDEDPNVRWRAATALGAQADRRATPVLIEMLGASDKDFVIAALQVLKVVKDPAAFDAVAKLDRRERKEYSFLISATYVTLNQAKKKAEA